MASDDLELQIKHEQAEIENAPKIPLQAFMPVLSGLAGRCHWCGRISSSLVLVEVIDGQERYKGIECCGERHA